MTLIELVAMLRATGYPVAHSHFRGNENNPPPSIPFITYTTPSEPNFMADNKTYHKITDVDIELYTKNKDLQAESIIENLLDENELPYDATQVWIDSEQVFQKIYEVRLI